MNASPSKIKVITWKWHAPGYRDRYGATHVNEFYRMLARHSTVPYEPLCITDDPTGVEVPTMELWPNPAGHYGQLHKPNCFYRLRMFSSEFTHSIGKFIWFDLDSVLTGNVDHLLTDPADFKIWRPDGERMPCNGSLVLHKIGTRPATWNTFDPTMIDKKWGYKHTTGFQGSDQAWIAHNLKPHDQFFEQKDGVYSYRSHIAGKRFRPPPSCCVVFFNGEFKPWQLSVRLANPWIEEHYLA
jgi:hypothetical protein